MRVPKFIRLSHTAVQATVSTSDVERDFYQDWAVGDRYWWWLCLIMVDPYEVIVEDELENLYRMPYTPQPNGEVVFGDLTPVRIVFEDQPEDVAAKADTIRAAVTGIASVRGERVAAKYESREESRRNVATKGDLEVREFIERMRAKLGLAASAPDHEVLAKAATYLEANPDENPDVPVVDPDAPEPDPDDPDAPEPQSPVAPPTPQPQSRSVTVDAEALAQLQADAAMGREARVEQLTASDEAYVVEAIRVGKIPPSGKASSLKRMERNRDEERAYLDSLAENVIPVNARGGQTNGGPTPTAVTASTDAIDNYERVHMPDVWARKQRIVQSGGVPPRVSGDGSRIPGGAKIE